MEKLFLVKKEEENLDNPLLSMEEVSDKNINVNI